MALACRAPVAPTPHFAARLEQAGAFFVEQDETTADARFRAFAHFSPHYPSEPDEDLTIHVLQLRTVYLLLTTLDATLAESADMRHYPRLGKE